MMTALFEKKDSPGIDYLANIVSKQSIPLNTSTRLGPESTVGRFTPVHVLHFLLHIQDCSIVFLTNTVKNLDCRLLTEIKFKDIIFK